MDKRRLRAFQALILALTGFFLVERVGSGRILLYINQRYVLLVIVAAIALIALAQMVLQERRSKMQSDDHSETEAHEPPSAAHLAWLALPLIVGLLVPARALGTSSLASRGIITTSPFSVQSSSAATALDRPASQRTVLDWIRAFHAQAAPAGLNGEEVDLIGFVYHDPRLATGQFLVGRYTVACCIADATAIGIPVIWEESAQLANNQWVRVKGKILAGQLDGQAVPQITADQVIAIQEPDQPYLFP